MHCIVNVIPYQPAVCVRHYVIVTTCKTQHLFNDVYFVGFPFSCLHKILWLIQDPQYVYPGLSHRPAMLEYGEQWLSLYSVAVQSVVERHRLHHFLAISPPQGVCQLYGETWSCWCRTQQHQLLSVKAMQRFFDPIHFDQFEPQVNSGTFQLVWEPWLNLVCL